MGHYDDVLIELKQKGQLLANNYIMELYNILRDEEKLTPEDARAKIEHDCLDLWSKATIGKYLPPETKDSKKQRAGKIGATKKKEILLLATGEQQQQDDLIKEQNEDARINLAENGLLGQMEQKSRIFQDELNQELSTREPSSDLYDIAKMLADKDKEIKELINELHGYNYTRLFLPRERATEMFEIMSYNVSSSEINNTAFILEHNGEEVIAIYKAKDATNNTESAYDLL